MPLQGKQGDTAKTTSQGGPLGPYLGTPIALFILDPSLNKQLNAVLPRMGFSQVQSVTVKNNYFQAVKQLFSLLIKFEGLVLCNHPPRKLKDSTGRQYDDPSFEDFYGGVKAELSRTRRDPLELLGRCAPVLTSAQDHDIRGRIIEALFPFGIAGAFLLKVQDLRMPWEDQLEERADELQGLLLDYFMQREHRVRELKEYKTAEELRQRRAEAEQLMIQVEELKRAKEYDKAIALCRRAAEVLPTDPEPYLEGGRMLVKKKRYPPALQMFRDAEKVAEELPGPHQEIGHMRVAQVKDYVERKKETGEAINMEVVNGFLREAVESYGEALKKAGAIRALNLDSQEEKRREAVASIAEGILGLGLEGVVGEGHPLLNDLVRLSQEALTATLNQDGELNPRHLLNFGLSSLYQSDYQQAEKYFLQAAQVPETHHQACIKLNFMGTYLRQRGQIERALDTYRLLIDLRPSFMGVVLFNLAVALQDQATALAKQKDPSAQAQASEAAAVALQALYVDPNLPMEENFYQNTIMAPVMGRLLQVFNGVVDLADSFKDPMDDQCRQACDKVEALLGAGQEREALAYMYELAQKLQPFFIKFDRYASDRVLGFAKKLHPILLKNPKPKMKIFGKILGVLVTKGEKALEGETQTGDPELDGVLAHLLKAEQAKAARDLTLAFLSKPQLIRDQRLLGSSTMVNLCREIQGKLSGVDMGRFS